MPKKVEHCHWPDAPDIWMPYAPAIKVTGGTTVYLAGVTAAPVYHSHPHIPDEFADMPDDMDGQARAVLENMRKGLDAVGATFADIVTADRFLTDMSQQDILNKVWAEYFGDAKPAGFRVPVFPDQFIRIQAVDLTQFWEQPGEADRHRDRGHPADNDGGDGAPPMGGDAGFELAQFVGCANKYCCHGADPAAHFIRGDDLHQVLADEDAD